MKRPTPTLNAVAKIGKKGKSMYSVFDVELKKLTATSSFFGSLGWKLLYLK